MQGKYRFWTRVLACLLAGLAITSYLIPPGDGGEDWIPLLSGFEDLAALEKGLPNLLRHVSNITNVYKLPCVVAVNRFPTDTDAEIALVIEKCKALM